MTSCIRADVILGTLFGVLGVEALLLMGGYAAVGYARRRGWLG